MRRRREARFAALTFTVCSIIAILVAIALVDRPVATVAHDDWHRPRLFVELTWIADWPVPIAALALLASGIASLAGWRPGRAGRAWIGAAIAVLLARTFADQLKYVFGRPWPETWIDHNPSWIGTGTARFFPLHGGRGYASFPSGHQTDIATAAALLWRTGGLVPRIIGAILVVLVAVGLVVSDYHFVGDVLAGLYLGIVVAYGTMAVIEN